MDILSRHDIQLNERGCRAIMCAAMTYFRTLALFFVVLAALPGAASAQVVPEIQIDLAGEWVLLLR